MVVRGKARDLPYESQESAKMLIYVGPDQLIPLSGVIGTSIGLALMFGAKSAAGCNGWWPRSTELAHKPER